MKWRRKTLDEMRGHLGRFGLDKCPICGSGTLLIERRPGFLQVGGLKDEAGDPRIAEDRGLYFVAVVICELCGYTMLFDSDKFHAENELSMYFGAVEPPDLADVGGA